MTVAVGLSPTFTILKPRKLTSFPSSSTFLHLSLVSPYSSFSKCEVNGDVSEKSIFPLIYFCHCTGHEWTGIAQSV